MFLEIRLFFLRPLFLWLSTKHTSLYVNGLWFVSDELPVKSDFKGTSIFKTTENPE